MTTLIRTLLCATLMLAAGLAGAQPSFTEYFTTTEFKSPATVAVWDTVATEMRLAPFAPKIKLTADTPGSGYAVTLYGHHALVADGKSGVTIVDVKWADSPNTITTLNTPGFVWDSCVHGRYAYLADQGGGVQVVDLSDPVAPVLAGSFATSSSAYGVTVMGDFLLVGASSDLIVLDISDPVNPVLAASLPTPGGGARQIALAGDVAYVTDGNGGLAVVDVSDPWAPSLITSHTSPGFVRDVEVRGDVAYVLSSGAGLEMVDISDPANPALLATTTIILGVRGLDVAGDRAFVAGEAVGVYVVDVSDPAQPALIQQFTTPGNAYDVAVSGRHAFVADKTAGLTSVEISQRIDPAVRGTAPGTAFGRIAVAGDIGYAADGAYDRFHVLDLSDPTEPLPLTTIAHSRPNVTAVHGDVLLVGTNNSLDTFDVSTPATPTFLGSVAMPNDVMNIVVRGDVVYAQTQDDLQVVNIAVPAAPVVMGNAGFLGLAAVAVHGDHLLISRDGEMSIFDVTSPSLPVQVATYTTGSDIYRIVPSGRYLFLATASDFEVIDFSSPTSPVFAGRSVGDGGTDLALVGDRAYVMRGSSLLEISIQFPTAPWRWTSASLGLTGANSLAQIGDYLLATSAWESVRVVQIAQHEVDLDTRFGESQVFHVGTDPVRRARFSPVQAGPVGWYLHTNGAVNPAPFVPGEWQAVGDGATLMSWAAELGYVPGSTSPVSSVTIEWLYDYPIVSAVDDVPNDQGRQVSLHWARSGRDFVGDTQQIVEYAVYREIDTELGAVDKAVAPLPAGASSALRSDAAAKMAAGWHFVTTVPVRVQDDYAVVVPTLADSTSAGGYTSTFMVSALTATPGVFFDSPPLGGQSVDNLAPGVPLGVNAAYAPDSVVLGWEEAPEADFQHFRVYRGSHPDFIPSPANLVTETAATGWTDPASSPWDLHYKVTAVDFNGNESESAGVAQASDVPGAGTVTALHRAAPNPFNPATTLRFSLASAGSVRLEVCDLAGRVVRTLVDGHRGFGPHSVMWDGRDNRGRPMASGVYFSRLVTRGAAHTGRLVLVK